MKFSIILIGAALCLFSSVEASISTNTPFKGVIWNGGKKEDVVWADNGQAPPLDQLGTTSIDLMAGGNATQVIVANIASVPATIKKVTFSVPKNLGPPGDFYFIKYTSANNVISFSGSFTIANIQGTINGFNPSNPNGAANTTASNSTTTPAAATNGTDPYSTNSTTTPTIISSNTTSSTSSSPSPSSSSANSPAAAKSATALPTSLSSDAGNLFPSFASVASAAVIFAVSYLY